MMKTNIPAWPLDQADHLAEALREQGESEEQILEFTSALIRLEEWQAPAPTPEDTLQLVDHLRSHVPAGSPIRQALQARRTGLLAEFFLLLKLVRTQVSIFQPSFWLASAVIVLLGGMLILSGPVLNPTFVLQVIGPLLSYLGTATAFRGHGLYMLEFELACPPSPRQLTLARLMIVLCYDIGLGLLLSLSIWSYSGFGFWLITLHWLAPLLLGAGLTLLLSLRIPLHHSAMISYVGWLAVLVSAMIGQNAVQGSISVFSSMTEQGFGLAGLAMMSAVIIFLPRAITGLLPRK
jgi:hypothetical protein